MFFYILVFFCILGIYKRKKIKHIYDLYKLFKNTVDPENKRNCCQLFYDMFNLAFILFFPQQTQQQQLDKFNKKHIKIPYEFKDNKYVYLLKVPKGIMPIDTIIDEDGNNVFDEIYPYLGPNLDCHGADVFPKDFGLKKVIIKDINNNEFSFGEDDAIIIAKQQSKSFKELEKEVNDAINEMNEIENELHQKIQ